MNNDYVIIAVKQYPIFSDALAISAYRRVQLLRMFCVNSELLQFLYSCYRTIFGFYRKFI
ncbi:MAG: hypothetical protein RLZZ416_48 [Candidatus Parcubacteria bacterium]